MNRTQLQTLSRLLLFMLTSVVCFAVCLCSVGNAAEPLPSWNEGTTKTAILEFVAAVTDKTSKNYVIPADRIATFDNDGTLWCEKPLYTHLFANIDRFKGLIKANPELAKHQPYKAISTKNLDYFLDLFEQGEIDTIVSDLFGVPFEGMTTDEFADWNRKWMSTWRHPRFNRPVSQLTYQPMVELVHYLQENDFQVHIFTADEGAFVKLVSQKLYRIPPEMAHGSSVALEYDGRGKTAKLIRTREAHYLDNWDAKPRLIFQSIGKRPIFAAGNSNGDLHMLQYVSQQEGPSMSVLVHHTDAEREYAYNKHTDKVMTQGQKDGWTVVDMKDDWKIVFPETK